MKNNDTVQFADYFTKTPIPRYAILSHTWGVDEEELTFEDIKNGTGYSKTGYAKISFCIEQCKKDFVEYFWLDTACIDKRNSSELSESIISMYRWYKGAEKCYVYLTSTQDSNILRQDLSPSIDLPEASWWRRGWTLQELLAPEYVEFFSVDGTSLGEKRSLTRPIHAATGLPITALTRYRHVDQTIEERLTWAARRVTKRPEDMSYCLQGILDVILPPLYGEGPERAQRRLLQALQELSDLSPYADHDSGVKAIAAQHLVPKSRYVNQSRIYSVFKTSDYADVMDSIPLPTEGTCNWIQESLHFKNWTQSRKSHILWYTADPGFGKSVMCRHILQQCRAGMTVLYFFFRGRDRWHSTPEHAVQALIHQMLVEHPACLEVARDYLVRYGQPATRTLHSLFRILAECLSASAVSQLFCIFDGLDECHELDLSTFLRSLRSVFQTCDRSGTRLKVFITSRAYFQYLPQIRSLTNIGTCDWISGDEVEDQVKRDINSYLQVRLSTLAQQLDLSEHESHALQTRCSNKGHVNFLCTSLIIENLAYRPPENLASLLNTLDEVPIDLEEFYEQSLRKCPD
jgi:hypothetical protein